MKHAFKDRRLNAFLIVTDEPRLPETGAGEELFKIVWNAGEPLTVNVDQLPVTIQENQIICCISYQTVELSNDVSDKSDEVDIRAFLFNRQFYCIHENDHEVSCEGLLFYGSREVSIIDLDEEERGKFETLYRVFLDEMTTRDSIQQEMLRMLLKRLIIKCTRIARRQHLGGELSQDSVELIRRFHVLVEQHFREKKSVREYADLLHKSPKTLSNLFSKSYDKTPLQVIHSRVVLEAKRLMIYTDKTTKQIAYDLGYEEAPYFSRLFKKQTGISPTRFREKVLAEAGAAV